MPESDLYPHLKAWLESNGYEVHAEVCDCDIAARKGGEKDAGTTGDLILIEMKKSINLDLVLQIVQRQTAHASVYAAVPAPKQRNKRWQRLTRLLKRLEAGLLLVHLDSALPRVEPAFHPIPCAQPKQKKTTNALLREMNGRSPLLADRNTGGTSGASGKKRMTAYRESAVAVAVALERTGGEAAPKTLRRNGAPEKTPAILRGNHYGWFERTAKGVYALAPAGRAALDDPAYAPLVAALREKAAGHPVASTEPKFFKYESI